MILKTKHALIALSAISVSALVIAGVTDHKKERQRRPATKNYETSRPLAKKSAALVKSGSVTTFGKQALPPEDLSLNSFAYAFQHPPETTKPGVFWYWISGNISKYGITKDIEAMKRVGIGRAFISTVDPSPQGQGPVKMLSDEWWEMTLFAIREGSRVGVDIGVFNCPGWSQSGGPWVKPEQSMRYLTFSETKISGSSQYDGILPVPNGAFTDVAVLAVQEEPEDRTMAILKNAQWTFNPAYGTSEVLTDGNLNTARQFTISRGPDVLDKAKWIWFSGISGAGTSPGTYRFRRIFDVRAGRKVRKADFVITADDQFTASLNDVEIGSGTDWSKPMVLDVTKQILPGSNVLSVLATNASASPAGLIATLRLEFENGEQAFIATDGQWSVSDRPIPGQPASKTSDTTWSKAAVLGNFRMGPWDDVSPVSNNIKLPLIINIKSAEAVPVGGIVITPDKVGVKVDCELQFRDAKGVYQTVKKFKIDRKRGLHGGPDEFGPISEAFPEVYGKEFKLIFSNLEQTGKSGMSEIALLGSPKLERYVEKQLAKVYQSPVPAWNTYLWPAQARIGKAAEFTRSTEVLNISSAMAKDGRLKWSVPKGNWTILRVGMSPTGIKNAPAPPEATGLEVDKMNEGHLKSHFDAYLGKLAGLLKPEERKAWKYAIVDSYEKGPQNWTDNLAAEFKKRYNYDPYPWLPTLSGRVVDNPDKSDRFLWDLRRLIADKVAYDYVRPLRESSHNLGMKLWLENYGHGGFPAESLQYGGQADEVAGEFWTRGQGGSVEIRQATSATHIYGKRVVGAEAFTSGGPLWTESPWSLKTRGDWATGEGVNNFVLHLYIHQPDDRVPGINAWFGTEFNRNNTWFEDMNEWISSIRRTHGVLQKGLCVADVAYFIGESTPFMTGTLNPKLPAGYNFDYINSEVILRDMKIEDGKFVLPDGMSYKLLVLPPSDKMRPEVLEKIAKLVRAGGAVLGSLPSQSPSLENYPVSDFQVRLLSKDIWENIDGKLKTSGRFGRGFVFRGTDIATALKTMDVLPDIIGVGERPALGGTGLTWTHRQTKDADVYFIANLGDSSIDVDLSFRVATGNPELWDPVSGEMRVLPRFRREKGRVKVPLQFLARQSYIIAFYKGRNLQVPEAETNFPMFKQVLSLNDRWQVLFDSRKGGAGKVMFDHLSDWTTSTDDRIKYYSGTALYQYSFNFAPSAGTRYYLNLGSFENVARVKLNGKDIGVVWSHPGRIEITKVLASGVNQLEIAVTNTWNNRLLGDSKLPVSSRTTWTSLSDIKFSPTLLQSGLVGPVSIEQAVQ